MDEPADRAQQEVGLVRDWVDRLELFRSSTLGAFDGGTPSDLCEKACDAWKEIAMADPPPLTSAAILIILDSFAALSEVLATVTIDWADTPDARDRLTPADVKRLIRNRLGSVVNEGRRWLVEGLPTGDEVAQRTASGAASMRAAMETLASKNNELNAQDAAADVERYGAVLLYRDPSQSDAPIFTKVASFTEEENSRYTKAHERLRRMIDSELLRHISDESDRLCDVLIGVLRELQDRDISLNDEDAMDERRRRIRSALISFTAALQIHEYQTIRSVRKTQGLDRSHVAAVKELFEELKKTSFEYRWLEALRDALQHGDINAFKWDFTVSVDAEPEVTVKLDRVFMLEFINDNRNKPWLKRRELEELGADPSVLDMIKAVQPLMGRLQEKLDAVLYPNVADDVATVRELISRFEGRQGRYFLQAGPGFTRRRLAPSLTALAPRVLDFAATYEPR
jgi:hypothetical protein